MNLEDENILEHETVNTQGCQYGPGVGKLAVDPRILARPLPCRLGTSSAHSSLQHASHKSAVTGRVHIVMVARTIVADNGPSVYGFPNTN